MKQIGRTACCLLALLFCLPSAAQNADDKKSADGVITTEEMEERLAAVESEGSVITTDKMKERLESSSSGGVITNSKLASDAATAAAGAFTNEDLGSTGETEGEAAEGTENTDAAEPSAKAQAEPDAERERLIGEIESELDELAERVRNLEGDADDARLRETESKLEELRRAVDALKKDE